MTSSHSKALVGFGMKLREKILTGALKNFRLNNFEFDFMMSKDSKYLSVNLDAVLFGFNIKLDFTIDFNSIIESIKALVKRFFDNVKAGQNPLCNQ